MLAGRKCKKKKKIVTAIWLQVLELLLYACTLPSLLTSDTDRTTKPNMVSSSFKMNWKLIVT